MLDKVTTLVALATPIVAVGIAIGMFQQKVADHDEWIKRLASVVEGFDVVESHLLQIDKRLNRLEYGADFLTLGDKQVPDTIASRHFDTLAQGK